MSSPPAQPFEALLTRLNELLPAFPFLPRLGPLTKSAKLEILPPPAPLLDRVRKGTR